MNKKKILTHYEFQKYLTLALIDPDGQGPHIEHWKTTITKKCRQQFKFDQLIVASALKLKKEHKGFMKLIRSANTNSIMLTNLGRLNIPVNYNNLKLLRCFHIPSVHLLDLPYVALATTTLQGEMVLNFTYTKAYFSAKTIESMVDNFMANLVN